MNKLARLEKEFSDARAANTAWDKYLKELKGSNK